MSVKVYPHGVVLSLPGNSVSPGVKRGKVKGWTAEVSRRNSTFLMSIPFDDLSGTAYAVTLTIPAGQVPSSEDYHRMIDNLLKRGRRGGWLRWHWLIECTAKATPHIHMTVWAPDDISEEDFSLQVFGYWAKIVGKAGIKININAQHVAQITSTGWLQYVSKHGARGSKQYQREILPDSWRERPGRMWGYGPRSEWDIERLPIIADVDRKQFWEYRRYLRAWAKANARKVKNDRLRARYIRQARTMLRCGEPSLSPVKPVSLWIPDHVSQKLLFQVEVKLSSVELTVRQERIKFLAHRQTLASSQPTGC